MFLVIFLCKRLTSGCQSLVSFTPDVSCIDLTEEPDESVVDLTSTYSVNSESPIVVSV